MANQLLQKHQPWVMLGFLFLFQLFVAFAGRSLAPLGVIIGADLELSMSEIGMFPAALFLGQSLISMPSGVLTDKVGSRKMIIFVTLVLSGSFFVMSFMSTFAFLLLLAVLSGLAYGSSHPTTNRGILYWFETKQRGTAMGIKQMGVTVGSALSALLLLPLANHLGWQTAILTAGCSLFIIGTILFFTYREPKTAFKALEKKETKPFWLLFRNVGLLLLTVSALLLNGSQMVLNTFIVLFAYEHIGVSLILAGVLLVISEVAGSLGRVCWGIMSDRVFSGKRVIVLLIISSIVAIQTLVMAMLPAGTSFYLLAVIVFILGFAVSGFNGVWMNATTEMVHPSFSGTATGISITFGSWGAILLPPIFGAIVDGASSYSVGWFFMMFLMLISIFVLVITMRGEKQQQLYTS